MSIFASTPATASASRKGPGVYLAAGVGFGRLHQPNPILLKYREIPEPSRESWRTGFIEAEKHCRFAAWSDSQAEHAARVLKRLAALTG